MPTSDELQAAGMAWWRTSFNPDRGARLQAHAQIVANTNGLLLHATVRLQSLWDQPLVFAGNRPPTYAAIAGWASGHADGGVAVADLVSDYINDRNGVTFAQLPPAMQQLVVITHVSETGRYGPDAIASLDVWMMNIAGAPTAAGAAATWADFIHQYPISMNSRQDAATEFFGAQ